MLRMKLIFSVLALSLFVALPAAAQTRTVGVGDINSTNLGLDFNGNSFNAYGNTPLSRFIRNARNAEIGAGFLYDAHTEGDHLRFFHADLLATGSFGVPGASGGIGVRGYFADRSHFDGAGAAIGGRLDYFFPRYNRLGVTADLWYSPDVLTGGDYQHYLQYGIDVNYQLLRQAAIYVGYRRLLLPVQGPAYATTPHAPDQGWHLGIRVSF